MTLFHIRTLNRDDAERLLQFEQDNRRWFERHIEPRETAFYSAAGVRAHIDEFLAAHANGTRHPCVVVDGTGAIIGRANLKDIDRAAGTAEVGYRIAEAWAGQGVASAAVRHLVELARTAWGLRSLDACVAARNLASARVLEKCAFRPAPLQTPRIGIDGAPVAGYRLALAA